MLKEKLLSAIIFLIFTYNVSAQCAMCRAQLESMDDQSLAKGINDGIVYLMAIPYILLAVIAFIIYSGYKKKYTKKQY